MTRLLSLEEPKQRQRTAALQDANACPPCDGKREASWSAAGLCRFSTSLSRPSPLACLPANGRGRAKGAQFNFERCTILAAACYGNLLSPAGNLHRLHG